MKIFTSEWMQELDSETIHSIGIPSIILMENASKGAADFFASQYPLPTFKNIIIIAGKGNNGGDGLAAGRILHQKGYSVHFILLAQPQQLNPDPLINFNILQNLGLPFSIVDSEDHLWEISSILNAHHPSDTFLIDAIFGTGLNKPLKKGFFAEVIQIINRTSLKIASIDIPSGLSDSFLPEEGLHVTAAVTAAFQGLKTAHIYPDGNKYCGKIRIIDIGIPHHLIEKEKYFTRMIEPSSFQNLFEKREIDAHKGSYGHTLTICGSIDKPGAGILSSFAVLKSGAGLCTAAVPFENRTLSVSLHPELMTFIYTDVFRLLEHIKEYNALLVGPGLGNTKETAAVVPLLIENAEAPMVLDADALNALKDSLEILKRERRYPIVVTPHPGEFSRLTGLSTMDIKRDRISHARAFASGYNVYLILKGHHTIIAAPGGNIYLNPTGNPGMATAGSGDVLSGILAGMISQFSSVYPIEAILQAAVFIHGFAGDLAAQQFGEISLTASDILNFIPNAILHLDDYQNPFPIAH